MNGSNRGREQKLTKDKTAELRKVSVLVEDQRPLVIMTVGSKMGV